MMIMAIRLKPLFLTISCFLILSTFLSLSHAQIFKFENVATAKLGEAQAETKNSSLILAEKETKRKDPLNGFKYYTGGWNIVNPNYLASVAFTSAPFAAIAVVWFVLFGLFLFCAFICCCCCRRNKPYGYSRVAYALSVIFLLLFTIAAIAGCVIMYTGEAKFMSSVTSVTKYIVNRGLDIVNKLISVYNYLSSAKTIVFNEHFLPSDLLGQIDNVNSLINATGNLPQLTSVHIHDTILLVLNPVNVIFFAITVFLIVLAFLGFLFSILGLQCCVYIFVVIGWIIITVTFLMCGVFLVFHNIVSDTCVAMDQWVQNPMANATLKEFLPCLDKEFGENVLEASKSVSSGVDTLLNQYIDLVANNNNQTGPLVPLLCEPNTTQGCGAGHVALGNAPEEWKKYVCEASKDGICTTAGRLTPDMYNHMTSAVNVSYGLNDMGPFLAGLVDCSMIIDTFKDISQNHCPGLKKFSQWVYIGLVTASGSVMGSLIFWVVYARERRHRKYTKKIQKGYDESPLVGGRKL